MTPNRSFPKALIATGLAAALIGCGGGSSDSASMPEPQPSTPEPAAPPAPDPSALAYKAIKVAYDSVNSLVQSLTVGSSAGQLQNARDQVDGLLSDIRTNADLSGSHRTEFLDSAQILETRIDDIEGKQEMAMQNREWHRSVREHRVPGRRPSRTGGGRTVSGLPNEWEGKQYGNLIIGPGDQGGRIFNNDEGMTDFETTWSNLAVLQHNSPDNYLGNRIEVHDNGGPNAGKIRADVLGRPVSGGDKITTRIHRSYFTQTSAVGNYLDLDAPDGQEISASASTGYTSNLFNRDVQFQCSVTCEVAFNSEGFLVVEFTSGNLSPSVPGEFHFDANSSTGNLNSHPVVLMKKDRSFSEFGYWATVTTSPSFRVNIDTFAEVMGDSPTSSPSALRGNATYEGLAAGFYTINQGSVRGQFTADVELTADFTNDEIGGMVDNFDSVTNINHDLNNWELTLEDAELDNTNFGSSPRAFMGTTMATGGSVGHWEGVFGGRANAGDSDNSNDYPEGVAGEFVGHFVNGHAAGAFGAEMED